MDAATVAFSQLAWVPGGPRASILILLLLLQFLFEVLNPSHHRSAADLVPPTLRKLPKDRKGWLCAQGCDPAWHRLLLVLLVGEQGGNLGEEVGAGRGMSTVMLISHGD